MVCNTDPVPGYFSVTSVGGCGDELVHGRAARTARVAWFAGYLLLITLPLALAWVLARDPAAGPVGATATDTGLLAFSLVVVSLVLMARVPSLVAAFGIEHVLLMHRLVAVAAVLLVLAHLGLVIDEDPRGWSILDVGDTSAPARAAIAATVAMLCAVLLALRRRRRRPRYEAWRMAHLFLAVVVVVGGWLHVWWLHQLSDHPVFAVWFGLLGLVMLGVGLRRWLWLPWRALRRSYVVEQVEPVAGDAVRLVLRAHRHEGRRFKPGQFAWLKIGTSPFVFEEHPFSISSTAQTPHRKEFTIKALGDFSELLRGLRPGRRVFLDGPYGGFTVEGLDASPGFVLIAGGVGVTPMLSILRTLADRGDRRAHRLLLGARTWDDLILRHEIEELCGRLDLSVVDVLEEPPEDWLGERGRIDATLLDRCLPERARAHDYFLCGPPPMVVAVSRQLRSRGVPLRRIHTERFEVV